MQIQLKKDLTQKQQEHEDVMDKAYAELKRMLDDYRFMGVDRERLRDSVAKWEPEMKKLSERIEHLISNLELHSTNPQSDRNALMVRALNDPESVSANVFGVLWT